MPRALPILIIVGLAIYSFFDVLQTEDDRIRRYPKTAWLVLVLIPVVGAALWFGLGRPRRSRGGFGPPRMITLKDSQARPKAPDDDPTFIRRLDEEAWRRKRDEQRNRDTKDPAGSGKTGEPGPAPDPDPEPGTPTGESDTRKRRKDGPGPAPGPGIAPAG